MKKKLTATLSSGSIDKLIDDLKDYQASLSSKMETFLNRLADDGISVGQQNCGEYASYIAFSKETVSADNQSVTVVVKAYDTALVRKQWLTSTKEVHGNTYSGLYMAEFGSGHYVDNKNEVDVGVKQGDLNKYGHAFDDEWGWFDMSGGYHKSSGETPTYPVYKTYLQMKESCVRIAREVFGS